MSNADEILKFWLGDLDAGGMADQAHQSMWWKKDEALDQQIRARFLTDHVAILAGERDGWLTDPHGRLACVIVLDQFSRNMFRGTPEMFASDARAQVVAEDGIRAGHDRALEAGARGFLYMPLMHSEVVAMQHQSVALFDAMGVAAVTAFAIKHRDIIVRFGRFPHRNAILGRTSTPDELEFLLEPGSSF